MDPELLSEGEALPTASPASEVVAAARKTPKEALPKSEDEWRGILTPEQYHVLREKGTERAFGAAYERFKHEGAGEYVCAGCGAELFSSGAKFDSGCGWPSFYEGLDRSKIAEHEDRAFGMRRVEVTCANCGGHLGHVFPDGHGTPTGMRYCINAVSIEFLPAS